MFLIPFHTLHDPGLRVSAGGLPGFRTLLTKANLKHVSADERGPRRDVSRGDDHTRKGWPDMLKEEKTFTLRVTLEARFPPDYEGDDDEYAWLHDWETRMKPDLLKTVMASLRAAPSWSAHVRNRGMAATDEVEIALIKDFDAESFPDPPSPLSGSGPG